MADKKTDVVLATPPFSLKENFGLLDFVGQYGLPINLLYLAASLEKAGISTRVADLSYETMSTEECAGHIVSMDPECVAISVHFTFLAHRSLKLASAIKKLNPRLKIVAGGVHFTALPEETMRECRDIDVGMRGEAEETIVDVVRCFRQNGDLKSIRGVIVREGDHLSITDARGLIGDVNTLPFPLFDKVDLSRYAPALYKEKSKATLPIMTSRGCPFACSFCDRTVLGSRVRFYDIGYLADMITMLFEKFNISCFDLVDENICVTRERFNDICRLFKNRFSGYGIKWGCSMRADSVDADTGKALYDAGCRTVSFGIESGSQKMLDIYNKKLDLKKLPEKCRIITNAGISLAGSFIIGGPGEDEASIAETVDLVRKISLDYMFLWYFIPLPGSPIYKGIEAKGSLVGDYSNRTGHHISFIPKALTRERLAAGYKSVYRAFYSKPDVIVRTFKNFGLNGMPQLFKSGIRYLNRFMLK